MGENILVVMVHQNKDMRQHWCLKSAGEYVKKNQNKKKKMASGMRNVHFRIRSRGSRIDTTFRTFSEFLSLKWILPLTVQQA